MGWESILGDIASISKNVAPVIAGMAQGSGAKSLQNADYRQFNNQLQNSQYATQQGAQTGLGTLDLARQKFAADDQSAQMKKALIASLLSKMQDANVSVPGIQNVTVTGGIRPSALDPGILATIQAQGLQNGTTPKSFMGGGLLPAPSLQSPTASPNMGLETGGSVLALMAALGPLLSKYGSGRYGSGTTAGGNADPSLE